MCWSVRPSSGRGSAGGWWNRYCSRSPTSGKRSLLTDDEAGQKAFYESLGYTQVTDNDGGALRAFARFDA